MNSDLSDLPSTPAQINGEPYAMRGRLASTPTHRVYAAFRGASFPELVVVKSARTPLVAERDERAYRVLAALAESTAQGSDTFRAWAPQLVARGTLRIHGEETSALVTRWRSGFIHTLTDVVAAHADGSIDGKTGVWMWKRALQFMGWVHASGYVHGAPHADHYLIHPRDHGGVWVGWSHAAPQGKDVEPAADALYTGALRAQPEGDCISIARMMFRALGGNTTTGRLPDTLPEAYRDLIYRCAEPGQVAANSAWAELAAVEKMALKCYGPPAWHPLNLPGLTWPNP
jgi:hypothetical protein